MSHRYTKQELGSIERRYIGRYIVISIFAFIAALIVGYGLLSITNKTALSRLTVVRFSTVLLALSLTFLSLLLRGIRWNVTSHRLGIHLTIQRQLIYYTAGYAFVLTPGKIGEVVRLLLLKRNHGIRYSNSFALLVFDRIFDVLALTLIAIISAGNSLGWVAFCFLCALTILMLILIFRLDLSERLVKLIYSLLGRWPKFFAVILHIIRSLKKCTSYRFTTFSILISLISWFFQIAILNITFSEFSLSISALDSALAFSVATLMIAIPIFPGGLGGGDGAMATILSNDLRSLSDILAGIALLRLCTLGGAIMFGLISLVIALLLPKSSK